MQKVWFVFAFVLTCAFPLGAGAAEKSMSVATKDTQELSPENTNTYAGPTNTTDCFDHYRFGSVQVDLSADLEQTVPGASMSFSGTVRNENEYPIVDGSVYVKIFRVVKEDEEMTAKDGYPLVDQFFLPDTFVIPTKGERLVSFSWDVPMNALDGEYFAAFFFQSAKRYNLLGLSFTDDVTGSQAHFSVTNTENTPIVYFDKHVVTLNEQPHAFAAFPRHFEANEDVRAEIRVVNPTDQPVAISLEWKLYSWDGLREDALHDIRTEVIELKPNENKGLSYIATPIGTSVSFLVVKMYDGYASSFLGIRFVRDGVAETRINFPSINSYPLKSGKETTLFSCVHSTNLPIVPNNVLTLTLKDDAGMIIHTYTYEGDITGNMMGVADTFKPAKDYANFSLTATLKRNSILVEEVTQNYRCQDIDLKLCPKTGVVGSVESFFDDFPKMVGIVLVIAIAAIGIVMALWGAIKRKRGVAVFLFFSMSLFFGVEQAEAAIKSKTWTSGTMPDLGYYWANIHNAWQNAGATTESSVGCGSGGCGWLWSLTDATASVSYHAKLIDVGTGNQIADASRISVGTRIRVDAVARKEADIFWNGTGYTSDSPYGHWVQYAGPRADLGCAAGDFTGMDYWAWGGAPSEIFHQFNVHPTTPSRSSVTGNLACDTSGICTVTGTGSITLGVTYPETYGKFYHRYYSLFSWGWTCGGNNVPLREITPWFSCNGQGCAPGSDYQLHIPAQTVTYSLTAYQPNTAPNAPTITGSGGSANTLLAFAFQATDPDGDTVHYGVDWNNDGVHDAWAPGTPTWQTQVASGTAASRSYRWSTPGTYTIQARTRDSNGSYSGWTQKTITITPQVINGSCGVSSNRSFSSAPSTGLCLTGTASVVSGAGPWTWNCNGSGGGTNAACQAHVLPVITLSANPMTIDYGSQTTLTWTTTNAASCNASAAGGVWNGAKVVNGSEAVTPSNDPATFTLTCSNSQGSSVSRSVTVTMNKYLKTCRDTCNGGSNLTNGVTINQNQTVNLKACYNKMLLTNPAQQCTDNSGDVTNVASWTKTRETPLNIISLVNGRVISASRNGSATVRASHAGQQSDTNFTIVCIPTVTCNTLSVQTDTYCPDVTQNLGNDDCGNPISCAGTRLCNTNLREVQP